jgi:hypothetical protein
MIVYLFLSLLFIFYTHHDIASHHNNSGGALIAPSVVLFAAHCKDYKNNQVNIGSYKKRSADFGAQPAFCNEWIDDPTFTGDAGGINNDFALCLLDKEVFVDTTAVKLILNTDSNVPASINDDLVVMGLGALAEGDESRKFYNRRTCVCVCVCVCVCAFVFDFLYRIFLLHVFNS